MENPDQIVSPKQTMSVIGATTNDQNKRLKEVFGSMFPELKEIVLREGLKCISRPFIVQVRDEYNLPDNTKIMFVGGETHEWSGRDYSTGHRNPILEEGCTVDNGLSNMTNFFNSSNYHNRRRPFWNFIHKINEGLNGPNIRYNYIWNNISKVDQKGERPSSEVLHALMPIFVALFAKEVSILKPDIIIFCCGPEYRPYLQEYLHLNHSSYLGKEGDKLEIVNGDLLMGPIKMYYSNHPRWLNKRDELENRLFRVAKTIVEDYRPMSPKQ